MKIISRLHTSCLLRCTHAIGYFRSMTEVI